MKTSLIALSLALCAPIAAHAEENLAAEGEAADNSILVVGQKDAPIEIAARSDDAVSPSLGFEYRLYGFAAIAETRDWPVPGTNIDLFGLQRGDTFGFTSELFALDARVNWDMHDHLRLSAGVDNITNDRAWVFHPYPQRSFLIEAGWRM